MKIDTLDIGVIGGGAWGTAIANLIAINGLPVKIWLKEDEIVNSINNNRVNNIFLPDIELSKNITAISDFSVLFSPNNNDRIIFWVVPVQYSTHICREIKDNLTERGEIVDFKKIKIVVCSKGIDNNLLVFPSKIIKEELGTDNVFVMSGPNFASEIALSNTPAITTIASKNDISKEDANIFRSILENDNFKIDFITDIEGTQLSGAIKNVFAIASGVLEGMNLSQSTISAFKTKAIKEMSYAIELFGGNKDTVLSPAAIGDFLLTCSSTKSRNMSFGYEIGCGKKAEDIIKSKNSVVEGYATAKSIYNLCQKNNWNLPICNLIYELLYQNLDVKDFIKKLF